MNYPFDQRFIFAVENIDWHENPWLCLISNDYSENAALVRVLNEHGFTEQFVTDSIRALTQLNTDHLAKLALQQDYRSEPAIAVLKTRATEEVFEKAVFLSQSISNVERALAVKILNSEHQKKFLPRIKPLLTDLRERETDELVLEQLVYAFSKLQLC